MRFRERKNHFEIWEPVVNAERTKVRCLIRWHPQGMKVPDNVSALLNENELKALYAWMTHRFKVPEGFGGKGYTVDQYVEILTCLSQEIRLGHLNGADLQRTFVPTQAVNRAFGLRGVRVPRRKGMPRGVRSGIPVSENHPS